VRVAARLIRSRLPRYPCADVLVGGQWGSEGKGNLAFFVAPEYNLLVRVGAPNAGHKVRCYDGTVYTHRQLPSGTRATEAPILLGAGAVLSLEVLRKEIADCGISPSRLTIDPHALIIEDEDLSREAGLKDAIGSTGTGGGAAAARRILMRGHPGNVRLACDARELSPYVRDPTSLIENTRAHGPILIEGTQGTGLSILHGSFPHVTSRDTTVGTLLSEVGIPAQYLRHVILAVRAYPIRVGGPSGPMGCEITWDVVASRAGLCARDLESAERGSVSRSRRRVAEFSWEQLVTSVRLNGATDIALTFADYIDARNGQARRFDQFTEETVRFIREIEAVTGIPVSLVSASFDGSGPIDMRRW
jgi:adenylosuccinate synthase